MTVARRTLRRCKLLVNGPQREKRKPVETVASPPPIAFSRHTQYTVICQDCGAKRQSEKRPKAPDAPKRCRRCHVARQTEQLVNAMGWRYRSEEVER